MTLNLNTKEKTLLLDTLKKVENPSKELLSLSKKIERSLSPIKRASAKAKGKDWQREICQMISKITKIPFDQSSDKSEIRSREASLNGTDVALCGRAAEKFPFCVECKNAESISLAEWVRQAQSNADSGDNWLLFIKSQLLPMKKVAVLPLSLFERIMSERDKYIFGDENS